MILFDIVWSIIGIGSFICFLIFYTKLKPNPYWGKSHPGEAWAICQIVFSAPRIGTLLFGWIQNRPTHYSPFLSIVIYLITGVIMLILARKEKMATMDHGQIKNIDEQMDKLSNK